MGARLVTLANVVEIDHRIAGRAAACENVARRSGGWFDPAVARAFLDCAPDVFGLIESESVWDLVLESEPSPRITLPLARLDEVTSAFADFADLKSPYLTGHSGGVARLASAAAGILGLGEEERLRLRHAGLLHDLGRVSVSNGIWDKPGPLGAAEWERVRLHPYSVRAVVEAAGERARRSRARWPAGLTEREVEVLRLLARGRSQREIAEALVISPSTAHTHIVHIYGKCGVSTRASVALFAMENDLIGV